jgi:hypothetical protein
MDVKKLEIILETSKRYHRVRIHLKKARLGMRHCQYKIPASNRGKARIKGAFS